MKKFLLPILLIGSIVSCKSDAEKGNASDSAETTDLKNEIAQLKLDQQLKDSAINEALAFFNEIEANLESIGLKKDEIRLKTKNNELPNNDKEWVLQQIRHINFLREENGRKVKYLNDQISKSGLKLKELEGMIAKLASDIQLKDEQIAGLQREMDKMDQEYSKLFDAYQSVNDKVDYLTEELNEVYYSYGTVQELVKNKVIEQKNGFIGIGKKIKISETFNSDYFVKLDKRKNKEIFIEGKKLTLISDHPSTSYSIVPDGNNSKIKITNPGEFWRISNYLIVVVD